MATKEFNIVLQERADRMRKNPTYHEKSMLQKLELAGYFVESQKIIGFYIVDFCIEIHKIIIEVDGDSHDDNYLYDKKRTDFLKKKGYKVVRVRNESVKYFNANTLTKRPKKSAFKKFKFKNKDEKKWSQLTDLEKIKKHKKNIKMYGNNPIKNLLEP